MKKGVALRAAASVLLALSLLFRCAPPPAQAAYVREFLDLEDETELEPLSEEEQKENIRIITDFLRFDLDLPDSAVAAILANMHRESSFDPLAIDDTRGFFGLCQWSRSRWMDCFYFCQDRGLDRFSLDGQLAFLRYELEGEYEWIYRQYLLPAEISEDGAQEAQYAFCEYYEAPLDPEWEQVRRSRLVAEIYWPLVWEGELALPEEPAD